MTKPPPKTVCIIHENESFGGMENHTYLLLESLSRKGHQIELVLNGQSSLERCLENCPFSSSLRVIRTKISGLSNIRQSDPKAWRELFGTLTSRTLILPKGLFEYGSLPFFWECRRRFDRVFVVEHLEAAPLPRSPRKLHFGLVPGLGLWRLRKVLYHRLRAALANRIIAVSKRVKDRLVTDWHYPSSKISVIQNGVRWQDFSRSGSLRNECRARYNLSSTTFVFGMLVRLNHQKAVDQAIMAAAQLRQRCPLLAFRLLIAGEGEEIDQLHRLVESLNLESHVSFVGFIRNPAKILPSFDVILFSSRNEGLPLALLEGMASGCVPIVTRVGGMPEAVSNSQIGWVVAPNDTEALCAAMQAAASMDNESLSRMKVACVNEVKTRFDADQAYEKILQICEL